MWYETIATTKRMMEHFTCSLSMIFLSMHLQWHSGCAMNERSAVLEIEGRALLVDIAISTSKLFASELGWRCSFSSLYELTPPVTFPSVLLPFLCEEKKNVLDSTILN